MSRKIFIVWVNYNGRFFPESAVPVAAADLAWQYGVSLFETMRFTGGQVPLLKYHFQRLIAGMQLLGMVAPIFWSADFLLSEIQKTVKKNSLTDDVRVRLQVSAKPEIDLPEWALGVNFKIETYPLNKLIFNEVGLDIGLASPNFQPLPLPYAHFKTGNYMPYFGAIREARQRGLADGLMRNSAGRIGEASTANVFWVRNGQLHTPPLTEPIVAGVGRSRLLQVLSQQDSPVLETLLTVDQLWEADALFLTNALYGLRWVATCEAKQYKRETAKSLFEVAFAVMTS